MTRQIISRAVAAALAASMALAVAVPAFAQPGTQRQDNPPLFAGQDEFRRGDGDWNDRDDWRRRKPDFQQMQRDCSKKGIEAAWNRNYYSAQYNDAPRLTEGRNGWELRGKMRMHDRRGYSYVDTTCEYRRGDVRFEFRR
jgi:hypothetical protein